MVVRVKSIEPISASVLMRATVCDSVIGLSTMLGIEEEEEEERAAG
jgi:hypothetical protein